MYEYPDVVSSQIQKSYVSENEPPLNEREIEEYLSSNRVLEKVQECMY